VISLEGKAIYGEEATRIALTTKMMGGDLRKKQAPARACTRAERDRKERELKYFKRKMGDTTSV